MLYIYGSQLPYKAGPSAGFWKGGCCLLESVPSHFQIFLPSKTNRQTDKQTNENTNNNNNNLINKQNYFDSAVQLCPVQQKT